MRKIAVAAGVAAGFALLSPAAALAESAPVVKQTLSVTVSGNSVTLHGTCVGSDVQAEGDYGVRNGHEPIGAGTMKADGHKQTITYRNIKPGKYIAMMFCQDQKDGKSMVVDFTIPAPKATEPAKTNQVAKKPEGAPQTGGGPVDSPAGDSGIDPFVVGGAAAGVTAVAGAGVWLLRRRRSAA